MVTVAHCCTKFGDTHTLFTIDFKKLFNQWYATQGKVWAHDRSTTCGASEVFNCMRQLVLEKRHGEWGLEPDDTSEESWGAMQRGNILEDHYVAPALISQLPTIGLELHFAGQANQKTLVIERNSSTPDGVITGIPDGPVKITYGEHSITLDNVSEGCIGLEIKSIDPRANLVEERIKHRFQSQVGLGLIRETTEFKPRYWVILYINASFIDDITPFVIEYDPSVMVAAKKRAEMVWNIESPEKAPPEGKLDNGCDYCRWTKACGAATFSLYHAADQKTNEYTDAALEPLVRRYLATKAEAAAAEHDHEVSKQALKDGMVEMKVRRVSHPEFSAVWSTVKGSKILDQKALKASSLDLTPYMKETPGYDKLLVTLKKEKNQ